MGEQSGREKNGQFGAGNRFGPGNPFARAVAELRTAALKAVTADDIDGIIRAVKLKAQAGDLAAARLILSYTLGRPGAPADPDTLEAHELRVRRESVPAEADWDAMHAVPASLLNPLARACVVASREKYRKMILEGPPAPAPAKEGPAGRASPRGSPSSSRRERRRSLGHRPRRPRTALNGRRSPRTPPRR